MFKNIKIILKDIKILFYFFQEMKDIMKTPRDDGETKKMPYNIKEMWGDAK